MDAQCMCVCIIECLKKPLTVSYREEMEDVVGSVFDLMGRTSDPLQEEEVISERVDAIFQVRTVLVLSLPPKLIICQKISV